MDPGLARTCPRSTSSLSTPRSRHPTLSPACPSSNSFRNISTPVTTVLRVSRNPTISTSSPTFTTPRPPRPLPTVPPPLTQKMSFLGRHKALPNAPPAGGNKPANVAPPPPSPPPRLRPPLPPPRHHRPPPRDRKDVLDRHQKWLVDRPHRRRNVAVHRRHQLPYAPARLRVLRPLHRPQRRPPHHRNRVPRKLVLL